MRKMSIGKRLIIQDDKVGEKSIPEEELSKKIEDLETFIRIYKQLLRDEND